MPRKKATSISIDLVAATDLIPSPNNSRKHSDEQVAQIAASIREFGFTKPILHDSYEVVAGHGARLAALSIYAIGDTIRLPGGDELPAGMVPVIDCAGWTETQRRAYVIADNKIAENSTWDDDLLRMELSFLQDEGFDLDVTGFDAGALARALAGPGGGLTDPDEVPEPEPAAVVTRLGDIWLLGDHRLICGDSTDAETVETLLDGERPHLMVTDPPYGVKYDPKWRVGLHRTKRNGEPLDRPAYAATGDVSNDDRADWREAWALFPGEVAYVWHGGMHAGAVLASLVDSGFEPRAQIIWGKPHFALSRGDYHWQHEPCWYAIRAGGKSHWQGDRTQTTLWKITSAVGFTTQKEGKDARTGHSTQKPVECMKRPIENNSEPGDAVYEPFSGSGSTIIAAEITGRRCFAVELSPAYVDVAVRRWQTFTGKTAVLADGGASFDEVAGERAAA